MMFCSTPYSSPMGGLRRATFRVVRTATASVLVVGVGPLARIATGGHALQKQIEGSLSRGYSSYFEMCRTKDVVDVPLMRGVGRCYGVALPGEEQVATVNLFIEKPLKRPANAGRTREAVHVVPTGHDLHNFARNAQDIKQREKGGVHVSVCSLFLGLSNDSEGAHEPK